MNAYEALSGIICDQIELLIPHISNSCFILEGDNPDMNGDYNLTNGWSTVLCEGDNPDMNGDYNL